MDLRELLLQFAGENEESLKLDELISSNIENVSICKDFNNGVELVVTEQKDIDKIIKNIDTLLLKNKYDSYEITKEGSDIIKVELI